MIIYINFRYLWYSYFLLGLVTYFYHQNWILLISPVANVDLSWVDDTIRQ